jgi:GPH family glycoside/pentoside/hexuronide:cation symporter
MVKLGFGVAALLSGAILSVVGFDAADVTDSAVAGMRAFYSLLPIAGVIGALLIMKNYDITEARAAQIKEELIAKRAELANPS